MDKLRVKEIIKEKGLTSKGVSASLNMSEAGFSKSISDNGNPPLKTLQRIADALGVQITDLFANGDNKTSLVCPHCGGEITVKIEKGE